MPSEDSSSERDWLRERYVADIECAIGLNVDCGGTEGVHRVRDAVIAARDEWLERLERSREGWIEFTRAATDDARYQRHRAERAEVELEQLRAERAEWREANAGLCALEEESRKMIKGYRSRAKKAEARVARVQAVADEWGEPYHCGWLSASVLVRQLRTALNDKETHVSDPD